MHGFVILSSRKRRASVEKGAAEKMLNPPRNTCSVPDLSSYPSEPLCFLPGGGRDGADGWEDESNDKKALERDRKRGKRARGSIFRWGATLVRHCWVPRSNAMSSSRQHSESRAIPTRTVLINDSTQLPHDYCTTPGGTLFSTTPGGKGISDHRVSALTRVWPIPSSPLCSTLWPSFVCQEAWCAQNNNKLLHRLYRLFQPHHWFLCRTVIDSQGAHEIDNKGRALCSMAQVV